MANGVYVRDVNGADRAESPSTSHCPVIGQINSWDEVSVYCQIPGQTVGGNPYRVLVSLRGRDKYSYGSVPRPHPDRLDSTQGVLPVTRRLMTATAALLLICSAAGSATADAPAGRPSRAAVVSVQVPSGVTAGVAVFDRQTGTFTEQLNESAPFRSASVVKILLALDFLWNRGPDYTVPPADRALLGRVSKVLVTATR